MNLRVFYKKISTNKININIMITDENRLNSLKLEKK